MNEKDWASSVCELGNAYLRAHHDELSIRQGESLPYANEIREYRGLDPAHSVPTAYETDLLVVDATAPDTWKPRVVIEVKIASVTTHDAITYSEKAFSHKRVHPYLRYGIMLGARKHYPLPGRLFRHGHYFDFMLSWAEEKPTDAERDAFFEVLVDEVEASRRWEEMIYGSRKRDRRHYMLLHRPLRMK